MTKSVTFQRLEMFQASRTRTQLCKLLIIATICSQNCLADAPIALYIGIRLADSSYAKVKEVSLDNLNQAYKAFPVPEIQADIDEITIKDGQTGSWVYSFEPHFTTQYLGGQLPVDPDQRSLYLSFEEDIPCLVSVPAIAYLPGNIIAGIGFTDLSRIYMLNDFPHTTLYNKGMTAKYSNDLLIALGKDQGFMADYNSQFTKDRTVKSYQVEIEGKSYTAYVIPLQPTAWSMLGYSHKFFTA